MTETTESLDSPAIGAATAKGRARKGEGLSGMVLTDLKALAGQLGIRGTSGMRKGDLVAAIAAKQNGAGATAPSKEKGRATGSTSAPAAESATAPKANGHSGTAEPTLPLGDLPTAPVATGDQPNAADQAQRALARRSHDSGRRKDRERGAGRDRRSAS